MTTNLSEKLFTQPDGKRFAYADEIKKAVRKLQEEIETERYTIYDLKELIHEIFGKELSE